MLMFFFVFFFLCFFVFFFLGFFSRFFFFFCVLHSVWLLYCFVSGKCVHETGNCVCDIYIVTLVEGVKFQSSSTRYV